MLARLQIRPNRMFVAARYFSKPAGNVDNKDFSKREHASEEMFIKHQEAEEKKVLAETLARLEKQKAPGTEKKKSS
jgi:hypothetical protein